MGSECGSGGDGVDEPGAFVKGRLVFADVLVGRAVGVVLGGGFHGVFDLGGVAVGSAWNSRATIPAIRGAAIEVPLSTL